jgi:membrane protein DedA with SNARE-associated domain
MHINCYNSSSSFMRVGGAVFMAFRTMFFWRPEVAEYHWIIFYVSVTLIFCVYLIAIRYYY